VIAVPTLPTRGGARERTKPQPNNTSGLLGIWFRWAPRSTGQVAEVCCAIGESRFTRAVTKRTPREVLREVIHLRERAGLAAPSLATAVRQFRRWRTNEAAHYRVALRG
jgi:hypothetical protein